jgi:hypothetical protein
MEFIFVCPETQQVFQSSNFEITENNGVRVAPDGSRSLDAKVVLREPCPHCGGRHAYHAGELVCPFEGPAGDEKGKSDDR